jgi:S-methylmethionine-dependent homocysteine/selenocysteine methylase
MAKYRHNLPQLGNHIFLTDGGLETTLVFHQGLELPEFAAFDLLKSEAGYKILENYYRTYIQLAHAYNVGFILESATWRANPDWGIKLGYELERLVDLNQTAIALLMDLRAQSETSQCPMVISGCVGPRGDGYLPTQAMSIPDAADYHRVQIETLRDAGADLVTAMTINYVEEAIGITQAAQAAEIPVVISFTVETDGKLPTGQTLKAAIEQVDTVTHQGPVYYMINCAHPSHFADCLATNEPWLERIRGIRANSSTKSHAELNESESLDEGNPAELGQQYQQLREQFPQITILGGCCGTDDRHIAAICKACLPVAWSYLSNRLTT